MMYDAKILAVVGAILECRTANREYQSAAEMVTMMPTIQNRTREHIAHDKRRAAKAALDMAVQEACK